MATISYGNEKPLCTEHNEDCWSQNRRGVTNASVGSRTSNELRETMNDQKSSQVRLWTPIELWIVRASRHLAKGG